MDEENESVEAVEHEITIFLRMVESVRKEIGTLDRSAYLLLGEIAQKGPLGMNVLAQTFQLDISTISRQVAALEASGLVERFSNPSDARVSLLQISALGQTKFQETHRIRYALFAELLESWPEEDRHQFGIYLERFNQAVRRRRNGLTKVPQGSIGLV
ncbi:MAG TPA: MarR family transcriptional regulator [Ktedonobacteraceae bacterium]|nr:MarR family transcriptional regulator [Ktedonobacteraceae bacterium]